ncbi:vitelline membrane outer layer protein 1-like [Hyla sarda]|uniref:vitelline membrane outer layer protein 1-like n=1 Tax=Hyla sarda TaxID=327740 RepID=UPI0024C2B1C2|nr:vitelline membrane outer layer protein 1-like [Hyla sarda]
MFERISTAWRNLVPNGLWGFGLSRAALNLSYHLYYWRMSRILYSFLLLSIFSRSFGDHVFIGIPNGGQWGEWGTVEWCPCGYHAKGFSLKVEEKQKAEDDTALNGIRLHCLNKTEKVRNPRTEYLITSTESPWGVWSPTLWCPEGHLIRFSMQVEPPRKGVDDTAANNVMFQCSDYEILFGPGQSWGHYGRWRGKCMDGICGIKTKVESPQGSGDDTALNDVQFICCRS